MIIARATEGADEVLLFGLSEENVKRLLDGKPMRLSRETHGDGIPKGWKILIFVGKTEAAMAEMIKPFCSPQTQIRKDPRL